MNPIFYAEVRTVMFILHDRFQFWLKETNQALIMSCVTTRAREGDHTGL